MDHSFGFVICCSQLHFLFDRYLHVFSTEGHSILIDCLNPGILHLCIIFFIRNLLQCGFRHIFQYTVREGETLWSLGQSYGIRTKSLARLNKLKEGDALTPGTTIKIR